MKARRGDLSGPVLAILITIVLLAIGAAIITYFVLLGGAPQQPVVAVVGQPVITKSTGNDFVANVTIINIGSTTLSVPKAKVKLNITGVSATLQKPSDSYINLTPGQSVTLGFNVSNKWSALAGKEIVTGILEVGEYGTLPVAFRVVRGS